MQLAARVIVNGDLCFFPDCAKISLFTKRSLGLRLNWMTTQKFGKFDCGMQLLKIKKLFDCLLVQKRTIFARGVAVA